MTVRRARLASLLAAGALAALATPVGAAATTHTRTYPDTSLVASGTVTYAWAASPALGCQAAGLCGVQGADTFQIQMADFQGGPGGGLSLQTSGTARTQGPAPDSSCVDPLNPAGFGVDLPLASRASVPPFAFTQGGPSAGRCAGPLPSDLAHLTIPVRRHGRSFDLRTVKTEVAGPYEVTLDSTLTLRPSPGLFGGSSSSSGGGFFGGGPPGSGRRFLEHLVLVDAVRPSSNPLQVSFSAAPAPFCLGLGACGATGTITLTVSSPARPLRIEAIESVPRPLSRAAALRAFAAGQENVQAALSLPATVTETVSTPGQPSCTDVRHTMLQLQFFTPGPAPFSLTDNSSEAVRTYCPGPLESDALPNQTYPGLIAAGSLSRRALLQPQATLTFRRASGFANPSYHGRWSGQLSLGLVRQSLRVYATGKGR